MTKEKNLKKKFSFDDLEIEKLKKEKLSEIPSIKKAKDDFNLTYKQDSKEKPLEKKSKIAQIFQKIATVWDKFKNSKVGKILFSNSLSYAISLGGAVIAVAGLFTPVSPLIIATAASAAIGVGIQAVSETIKIHNLRKLHKENNLLVQHRNAKAEQDYILSLEPSLNNILKNELYVPPNEGKYLYNDKYQVNSTNLKSAGIVLAKNIGGFASVLSSAIAQGVSGNVVAILKATGYGILTSASLITEGLSEKEKIEIKTIFKLNINEEYKKSDTPNYQNLDQLEDYTKKQILQTLALKNLITDENYLKMKDEDKKQKFKEIKNNFDTEVKKKGVKAFFKENKITIDNKKESYTKNFKRILDPFYESPSKAQEYSSLAKNTIKQKVQSKNRTTILH